MLEEADRLKEEELAKKRLNKCPPTGNINILSYKIYIFINI
jgi:hypothetical protein